MGNNFYTKWIDGVTKFNLSDVDPAFSSLDRAITYLKNLMIHCDGIIMWEPVSGKLLWSGTMRIWFNRADGDACRNKIVAGDVTLAAGEFAYVDLSETDDDTITVSMAAVTGDAASNFIAYNRIVLGIRNAASGAFYPVHFNAPVQETLGTALSPGTGSLSVAGSVPGLIPAIITPPAGQLSISGGTPDVS